MTKFDCSLGRLSGAVHVRLRNETQKHKTTHLLAVFPEVERRYGSDALPLHQLGRVVRAVSNHLRTPKTEPKSKPPPNQAGRQAGR